MSFPPAQKLLENIPQGLRTPLVTEFNKIVRNFRETRWEPAELNGGKLCEVIYSILKGQIDGRIPSKPSKPRNMFQACLDLEKADSKKHSRTIRIQIPRMLIALYDIRNSRGVGHVGGDVDPNQMDATVILAMAKWLMADLVRIFHDLDVNAAAQAIEFLTERIIPIVWEIDGKKRILNANLKKSDEVLLILYSCVNGVSAHDLFSWTEYTNFSTFKKSILKKLHGQRLIEFDHAKGIAKISPTGIAYVEKKLDLTMEIREKPKG